MAYPTGTLALVLDGADRTLVDLKTRLGSLNTKMAAGDVGAAYVLGIYTRLAGVQASLNTAKATPGIAAYAQTQKDDGTLDVVAEFNSVLAAIAGAITWIETSFPTSTEDWLQSQKMESGSITERQFTPAQTSGLRAALAAIIATID